MQSVKNNFHLISAGVSASAGIMVGASLGAFFFFMPFGIGPVVGSIIGAIGVASITATIVYLRARHHKKQRMQAGSKARDPAPYIAGSLGAVIGTHIGSALGTFFMPGIGTLVGGVLGALMIGPSLALLYRALHKVSLPTRVIGGVSSVIGGMIGGGLGQFFLPIPGLGMAIGGSIGALTIGAAGVVISKVAGFVFPMVPPQARIVGAIGGIVGTTVGSAVGTFLIPIPGLGMAIGAAVGAVMGGITAATIATLEYHYSNNPLAIRQILSTIGASVNAGIFSAVGAIFGPVGAVIGATVGAVAGGLVTRTITSLFFYDESDTPSAGIYTPGNSDGKTVVHVELPDVTSQELGQSVHFSEDATTIPAATTPMGASGSMRQRPRQIL